MRRIRHVSDLKPKPCKGHTPLGDPRDGRCFVCGHQVQGYREPPPSIEESVFELLKA